MYNMARLRTRIFTPQEATAWMIFLTIFGILGYIVFDGFMLSIPYSYALSDVSAIPQIALLAYGIGLLGCFGIARLYKPPSGVPKWVWLLLAVLGFSIGMGIGSGALFLLAAPFVLPYVLQTGLILLNTFLAWLLSLLYGFLFAAIMMAIMPWTGPVGAGLAMIAIMILAIVGYTGCIIFQIIAMTLIVLSQRAVSIALGFSGQRRGVGIGAASIVKGALVPFEITFFSVAVFALFVYAHVMVTVASLLAFMGSTGWQIGMGMMYAIILPGMGITAAGTTAFALTRLILKYARNAVQRIMKQVQGEYPWLSMLFVAYLFMFYAWFMYEALRIYVILTVLACIVGLTGLCFAKKIRAREQVLLNSILSTIVLIKPLAFWLGLVVPTMT